MTQLSESSANGGRRVAPPPAALELNLPQVVAEVTAVFTAYEQALMTNDVEAMNAAFSEHAVRYGIAECQYGAEAIAAWRAGADPIPDGRRLGPTVIATFGADTACVSTEFRYPGSSDVGRQTQTWIRLADGWRIVNAHVSTLTTHEEPG